MGEPGDGGKLFRLIGIQGVEAMCAGLNGTIEGPVIVKRKYLQCTVIECPFSTIVHVVEPFPGTGYESSFIGYNAGLIVIEFEIFADQLFENTDVALIESKLSPVSISTQDENCLCGVRTPAITGVGKLMSKLLIAS